MNVQPEVILGRHWNSRVGNEEVLIKCKDQLVIEATWVEMSSCCNFQIFTLRTRWVGGGIVRPLVIHTYQRKGKRGIAEKGESGDAAKLGREGEGNQRGVYEGFSGNLFGVWWNWSLWNFWEREALSNQPLSFLIVILFYVLVLILFLFRYIRTIVILIVLFFLVISNFQKLWKYSGICLVGYFSRAGWRYLTKTKLSTEVRVWPWMLCFKLWFVL